MSFDISQPLFQNCSNVTFLLTGVLGYGSGCEEHFTRLPLGGKCIEKPEKGCWAYCTLSQRAGITFMIYLYQAVI